MRAAINSPSRLSSPRSPRSSLMMGRGFETTNGNKLIAIVFCIGIACFGALWYSPQCTEYTDIHRRSNTVLGEFSVAWLEEQSRSISHRRSLEHGNNTQLLAVEPFSQTSGINVWDWFTPTISCPELERIGKIGEGGKWMCSLKHLTDSTSSLSIQHVSPPCVVYSFGISNDISFEVDLLMRTSCVVHCFDPTIGQLPFDELPVGSKWEKAARMPGFQERFTFHKVALGNISGATELFAISEAIFDIMEKNNHQFIDVLKIDVEGGEWSVFNSLYHEQQVKSLPVGQLLIELHYSNMYDVSSLFDALASWNLHPFSREINLIPCLNGGLPFAVEYSFINPFAFFSSDKRDYSRPISAVSNDVLTKSNLRLHDSLSLDTPSTNVKGVVYLLTKQSRIPKLIQALSLFYQNYLRSYPIPLLLFHDDFTDDDKNYIQKMVPYINIDYVEITFEVPVEIEAKFDIPDRTKCDPKFSTIGYRHMCRFHAEDIHRYLLDENNVQLQGKYANVDYIWRLDDDSHITAPIGYDIFEFMSFNKLKYGFVNTVQDDEVCVEGLWEHAREWVKQYSMTKDLPPQNFFNQWPDPLVIYNNFEISHVSLWKSDIWKSYFSSIEDMGGIYRFRWGDAPIHTIAVSMMLSRSEVHSFSDVGYRHLPFVDQKGQGLNMPNIDPFLSPYVDCRYYDKWRCNSKYLSSENSSAHNASNFSSFDFTNISPQEIEKDRFLKFALDQSSTSSAMNKMFHLVANNGAFENVNAKDVFYSFGYIGKEQILLDTITSFYEHYLSEFPTHVVIFYEKAGKFNVDLILLKIRSVLPSSYANLFQFVGVVIDPIVVKERKRLLDKQCSNDHTNIINDNAFFQYQAAEELSALGYDWLFRFNFNSLLLSKIHYNIFDFMRTNKFRYGYVDHLGDSSNQCLNSIWDLGRQHCRLESHDQDSCRGLFNKWPDNNAIVTSFAVAHKSVFSSPICSNLLTLQDQAKKSTNKQSTLRSELRAGGVGGISASDYRGDLVGLHYEHSQVMNWPESATHTMCVLLSLKQEEIVKLPSVDYKLLWHMKPSSVVTSSESSVSETYDLKSIPEYDKTFSSQRLGWLGGDIATSVPLPTFTSDDKDQKNRVDALLWLYGDSIIGIANKAQRIQAYSSFISNTVGISTMEASRSGDKCKPRQPNEEITSENSVRKVSQVKYYWRENAEGMPAPIFNLNNDLDICNKRSTSIESQSTVSSDISVWPITGISIINEDKIGYSLVVIASIACRRHQDPYYHSQQEYNTDFDYDEKDKLQGQFDFEEVANAIFVVSNPEASPDMWHYEYKIVPSFHNVLQDHVLRMYEFK